MQIPLSLGVAYFVYSLVFRIDVFPFMNLLTVSVVSVVCFVSVFSVFSVVSVAMVFIIFNYCCY